MKVRRDVAATLLAALLAACGGSEGPSTATTPPSGLTYSTNPAVYAVGTVITPNTPTSSGGAVASYAVSPALPPGTSLNTATGVIGGTPTAVTAGANYTVTAINAAGSTTAILLITVNPAAVPPAALVYSVNPAVYAVGATIVANTPNSSGGAVASYSVAPPLPVGLSLNTATGVIGGTPTAVTAAANYTVTATNSAGSTTAILTITVSAAWTCPITTAPSHPTFSADIHPFLLSTCGSSTSVCHGGSLASGHVDYSLSSTRTTHDVYADIVGASPANAPPGFLRVAPGDPGHSWILSKVTQDQPGGAGYGARMPLGSPNLCPTTVDALVGWIASGAPY